MKFFTMGSHQRDVHRLQGPPSGFHVYKALGEVTWSYEFSSVTFDDKTKLVTGWNDVSRNLKVKMRPGPHTTDIRCFAVGSHQDDVVRLQGTPRSISESSGVRSETWHYGPESVTFDAKTKRVTNWDNPTGTLKVEAVPFG